MTGSVSEKSENGALLFIGQPGNGAMLFAYCWPLFWFLHAVSSSKTEEKMQVMMRKAGYRPI